MSYGFCLFEFKLILKAIIKIIRKLKFKLRIKQTKRIGDYSVKTEFIRKYLKNNFGKNTFKSLGITKDLMK